MSYANGIGNLQQDANRVTPSEVKHEVQVSASDSVVDQNDAPNTNVGHADHANLSSAASVVAQALEGSDTRSTKVAALQSAIAAGTYNVSSSDVAEKIIQSLLD
jgi:negative regulator of flagellin synthesis FlgM